MLSSNYLLYPVIQCPFLPKTLSFYSRTVYCC